MLPLMPSRVDIFIATPVFRHMPCRECFAATATRSHRYAHHVIFVVLSRAPLRSPMPARCRSFMPIAFAYTSISATPPATLSLSFDYAAARLTLRFSFSPLMSMSAPFARCCRVYYAFITPLLRCAMMPASATRRHVVYADMMRAAQRAR